jgi:hypothetical protein
MSIEPKFLNIETRMANPTATSAAAAIEKRRKFVLVHLGRKCNKQRLTAFSIISDINTIIAFRHNTPKTPIQKKYRRKENVVFDFHLKYYYLFVFSFRQ